MNPQFRTVALAAAALGLLLSLFIALRPGGDENAAPTTTVAEKTAPATTAAPPTVEAEPRPTVVDVDATQGTLERVTVPLGGRVVLNVTAAVTDDVHLHGYDLMADVAPGRPAKISFDADVAGRFEVELEDRRQLIAELTVEP